MEPIPHRQRSRAWLWLLPALTLSAGGCNKDAQPATAVGSWGLLTLSPSASPIVAESNSTEPTPSEAPAPDCMVCSITCGNSNGSVLVEVLQRDGCPAVGHDFNYGAGAGLLASCQPVVSSSERGEESGCVCDPPPCEVRQPGAPSPSSVASASP